MISSHDRSTAVDASLRVLSTSGYCLLPQVLETRDVTAMRQAINETIDRVAMALRTPFPASCPNAPLEERLEQVAARNRAYAHALYRAVLADAHCDPRMEALVTHRRLRAAIDALLAPLVRDGEVIRSHAATSSFSPASAGWRQDVLRADEGSGTVRFACWVPLRDVDEATGALEVAPGRWREPLSHVRDERGHVHIRDLAAANRRVVTMRRGDVLILDRFLPHRALPVVQGTSRWAVMMWIKAAQPRFLPRSGERQASSPPFA